MQLVLKLFLSPPPIPEDLCSFLSDWPRSRIEARQDNNQLQGVLSCGEHGRCIEERQNDVGGRVLEVSRDR